MVFSSHIFLFYFLPLSLLLYYSTPHRWRSLTLTLLSYLFYGWWNPWFTLLMLGSTLIDYGCGRCIAAPGQTRAWQKAAMLVSVFANLAILGFFKYAIFVSENIGWGFGLLGLDAPANPDFLSGIVLPVGISFYTFQSMSYSIDLYRGHARPASSFIDFACYVSMFPQLVAGPIVRYGSVAEQFRERTHSLADFVAGFTRFNYGFAKKILLANPMGEIADLAFEAGDGSLSCLIAWTGALAYAFQIYFDFSGYSDMALGLGRMLGFRFPENFDSPYKSCSITDFWRRWHISLSTFLRDYLYIPLGGNRRGRVRTCINLMTVMLIGGLWHGAQWNFVVWGGIHGVCLAVERWWRGRVGIGIPCWIGGIATVFLLLVTWVFFRAENLQLATRYLFAMAGFGEVAPSAELLSAVVFQPFQLTMLGVCAVIARFLPNSGQFLSCLSGWKIGFGIVILYVSVRVMGLQGFNPFLYFQF